MNSLRQHHSCIAVLSKNGTDLKPLRRYLLDQLMIMLDGLIPRRIQTKEVSKLCVFSDAAGEYKFIQ